MSCDIGEVMERLKNEQSSQIQRYTAEHILQPFRHFTYVTAHSQTLPRFTYVIPHSPTLPLLHLFHSSYSNPSVALLYISICMSSAHSTTICHFTYVTSHSPTLPLLHLCHSSFSNPFFTSPTSQALHLRHLVSRPCKRVIYNVILGLGRHSINVYIQISKQFNCIRF